MEIILLEVNRTGCKQNFARAAIKLIGVTDSGRASIIAATDAATPNLRCIKGAALTAATPVTYHNLGSSNGLSTPVVSSQHGFPSDSQLSNSEWLTLDSVFVQCLKHQYCQCFAPINTLPPLSLLHPHV
ncbi:DDB1- and CUL4-associated factor homolog 1-like isoform X1 [Lycium ferocissimum]|uniref:DDB1- and CUL4-associated factor homolog 1-like isoform X1 n=1 Tax=Lycium ferocissimum TaxID=112874 RepID=UPI002814F040|nr:DDB1- and CUL4-associated factor homolog 1-like isoform X1 [Lycium ferocissimum]